MLGNTKFDVTCLLAWYVCDLIGVLDGKLMN